MQERQRAAEKALLSAHEVQQLLHVDRSTVYRMAEDGRLTAIKIGRQWRFPAADIQALLDGSAPASVTEIAPARQAEGRAGSQPLDVDLAAAVTQVAAELLGVMMVVTDMDGRPITEVSNPCPWFAERLDDPTLLETCTREWQQLADDPRFEPTMHTGQHGFDCARAFIRSGSSLVGMVLAGGIAPPVPADSSDVTDAPQGLYDLDDAERARVLAALPKVAATLSRVRSRDPQPSQTSQIPQGRNAS
jgi:excisionase family DNA binding protein